MSIDGIYHTWTVCDAVARLTARRPTPGLLTGILACLDGYMNIAMEQTEEVRGRATAPARDRTRHG